MGQATNQEDSEQQIAIEAESFSGHILIYVDGYRVEDWRCIPHNYPEDTFPFPDNSGWAVGDNPRDRYCSRLATDKIRRFKDYEEAVRYVFEKQRKWKRQRFQLIYQLDTSFHEVSTLGDILAIDKAFDDEQRAIKQHREMLRRERAKELPGLDVLRTTNSPMTAFAASELLKATLNK
jgi:hypothetical protein